MGRKKTPPGPDVAPGLASMFDSIQPISQPSSSVKPGRNQPESSTTWGHADADPNERSASMTLPDELPDPGFPPESPAVPADVPAAFLASPDDIQAAAGADPFAGSCADEVLDPGLQDPGHSLRKPPEEHQEFNYGIRWTWFPGWVPEPWERDITVRIVAGESPESVARTRRLNPIAYPPEDISKIAEEVTKYFVEHPDEQFKHAQFKHACLLSHATSEFLAEWERSKQPKLEVGVGSDGRKIWKRTTQTGVATYMNSAIETSAKLVALAEKLGMIGNSKGIPSLLGKSELEVVAVVLSKLKDRTAKLMNDLPIESGSVEVVEPDSE